MTWFIAAVIAWSIALGLIWVFFARAAEHERKWDRDNRAMLERMMLNMTDDDKKFLEFIPEQQRLRAFSGDSEEAEQYDKR